MIYSSPLLNLCLSHSALMESLVTPLQDKIEDWKKTANQLDKDHAKGTHTSQVEPLSPRNHVSTQWNCKSYNVFFFC